MQEICHSSTFLVDVGYCTAAPTTGCDPLPFVPCNTSDSYQFFYYTAATTLQNAVTGYCTDPWAQTGPTACFIHRCFFSQPHLPLFQVGAYSCQEGTNQGWLIRENLIASTGDPGECLAVGIVNPNAAAVVIDEAGAFLALLLSPNHSVIQPISLSAPQVTAKSPSTAAM